MTQPSSFLKQPSRKWIYLIILFGILIRILYAFISVDVADHYINLLTAKSMRACWCVPTLDMYGTAYIYRPPASHFWLGLFMPYPKIAPLLFGCGLIVLTYLVSRRLGKSVDDALFSTAIVSVVPIAVEFSSINSLDIFTGVYILLAVYFFLNEQIFWTGFLAALGFLAKYDAFAFAPAPAVYLFWKKKWKHLAAYLLVFVIVVLPWLFRMGTALGNPFYPYFETLFGHYSTPAQGHAVPLYHYLLGLPLTLFGVPEGDHRTALTIAAGLGISSIFVWIAYILAAGITILALKGLWNLFKSLSRQHKVIIGLTLCGYGIFYLVRIFVPIGSEVFDLRYALALIPLLAMGVATLDTRTKWIVMGFFILGSLALVARFSLAREAFAPYSEALNEVRKLPSNAVVLFDNDPTIFSYGIEYHTGRLSFPYLDNPINKVLYHIPYIQEKYEYFKAQGPNYLWTTNTSLDCGKNQLFKNRAITLCTIGKT